MKRKRALAAAGVIVAGLAGGVTTAGANPPGPRASVRSVVIDANDPTVAYVTATYICYGGDGHLWVSVKESENARYDPALAEEGSSADSAAWSQSHPQDFLCDGNWHTQTFTVDQDEQGFGTLRRGVGWVQFCLFDAAGGAVFDQHFRAIR